ncbi:alpha/beta fold hydrolase [Aestuariibius sp. 2305UL40-4]|uniref:alpha/beta fold hydrolase n=1 Tax=Aestuariibius violaceus TaxID=3234132 RepID=UPI00345E705A
MLNATTQGQGDKVVIAHGLYGSGRNWGVIAKRLSDAFTVITPDMRNHGDSPNLDTHSYQDLAEDLAAFGPAHYVGHSMGGKAVMTLALTQPALVQSLAILDIAPVAYSHSQMEPLEAMRRADLSTLTRRSELDLGLDPATTAFLAQSLDVAGQRWRLNLDTLADEMPKIMGFPDPDGAYTGRTLVLRGETSDYVRPDHEEKIRALFPKARIETIPGAGHWLHADNPREVEAALRGFLSP